MRNNALVDYVVCQMTAAEKKTVLLSSRTVG